MKNLRLLALCLVAFPLIFTGCNDDDNNGGGSVIIEGIMQDWENYDLDSVYLVLYSSNGTIILSYSELVNGAFKLTLPSTIADEYLWEIRFRGNEIIISDSTARENAEIYIEAYKDGGYVGYLWYGYSIKDEDSYRFGEMSYRYVNKRVTVTVTEKNVSGNILLQKYTYNLDLIKGWNKVYEEGTVTDIEYEHSQMSQGIVEITTTPIGGLSWQLTIGY